VEAGRAAGTVSRSAALLLAAAAVPLLAGPLVCVALLLQGALSLHAVNLVSSLVYAVAVPYAAIATTYLSFDLAVRERLEPRADAGAPAREPPAEI
jgi:cation transporter-like permease